MILMVPFSFPFFVVICIPNALSSLTTLCKYTTKNYFSNSSIYILNIENI